MPVFTSNIELSEGYPTVKPSLNLDFAATRSMGTRAEFFRTSNGTYVGKDGLVKSATHHEPRFDHDPTTLESLGLLLEDSRTNQFGNHDFTTSWATTNCSFVSGIVDPKGGTNAKKLVVTSVGSGASAFITDDTQLTIGSTYTQSFWAKANAFPSSGNAYYVIQIAPSTGFSSQYRNFDLSNGTLGSGDIPDSACSIVEYPNGWYRVSVTRQATSGGSGRMAIGIADSPTSGRLTEITTGSAGNDGIYLWGAQLEINDTPSSLIETSGGSGTRAADYGYIDGIEFKRWFNQAEGTFDVAYQLGSRNSNMRVCQIASSASASVIDLIAGSGGGSGGYWFINNTTNGSQFSSSGILNSSVTNRKFRSVLAYKENDCAAQQNNINTITTNSNVEITSDYIKLLMYQSSNSGDHINGHVRFIRYYPKRLTNAQVTLLSQENF